MTMVSTERELGTIINRLDNQDRAHAELKATVGHIRDDVAAMRDILVQAKGGWKTFTVICGAAAAIGAVASKAAALVTFHP
jgi:hypothetical protein